MQALCHILLPDLVGEAVLLPVVSGIVALSGLEVLVAAVACHLF